MTVKSYDRQHLALFAAGYINAAGTTAVTFGCQMTRIATGHYGLILDADNGLVDDESFSFATVKNTDPRSAVVEDVSNGVKAIRVFTLVPSAIDSDIEVALYRPVNR